MTAPAPRSLRGRAVAAAAALVAERGAEAVGIRAIAERAGVGASSLYHHFPGKEELLLHVALAGYRDLARAFDEPPPDPEPDPEPGPGSAPFTPAFTVAAQTFMDQVTRRPRLFDLMFDQHLMARHAELRAAERAAYAAFTARVEQDPRFPPRVAGAVALTLWTLGRGVTAASLSEPEQELGADARAALGEALAWLIDRQA